MAIRKSMEETVVVNGNRDLWFDKIKQNLSISDFKNITADPTLFQIQGNYRKFTVFGEILITLLPSGDNQTELVIKSTANVDNIFALFKSPNKTIIEAFKSTL